MRIGSIVFATDQGLGYLAKDFFDNGIITDALVLRHGRRKEHDEWFSGQPRIGSVSHLRDSIAMCNWLTQMDAMLFLETPFEWGLIDLCRSVGVKTVLSAMHECMPDPLPATPDLFINPSALEQQIYGGIQINVPVPAAIKWHQREQAKVFVHNAGNGGLLGRNGTKELVEAWRYVESPAKLIIRCQEHQSLRIADHRIELITGTVPFEQLYDRGDIFIFPESLNGLSLPLQEAYASGMAVMATDRFPINTWLPQEPLIPVSDYVPTRIARRLRQFSRAIVKPHVIAQTVDQWYGKDIADLSLLGAQWAEQNSWQKLRPIYLSALASLVGKSA